MLWNNEPEISRYGSEMLPAKKQLRFFIIGWIGFQFFAIAVQIFIMLVASLSGHDGSQILSLLNVKMLVNSSCYIVLLATLVLIGNIDIVKLLKSFKQYQSYIAGIVCLIAIFAFNFIYSVFLKTIDLPTTDNANESNLQRMQDFYPFACIIVFGFIGPICEELTYRTGLFSFLCRKSKGFAYGITIAVFALIHFNFSTNATVLLNEVLNLPFYAFAAAAFCFTYDKYGLAGSLTAHVLNNIISLSLVSIIH